MLLTRDIGEADRFCILFTREAGKRAARARGVRKPVSKLGGLLLPLRHVFVEVDERGQYAAITSVRDAQCHMRDYTDIVIFSYLAQGVELLLRLTEDNEPLPGVFDLLLEFRDACIERYPEPLLPFQLRLLQELGHLPVTADDPRFARLSLVAQSFVWSCAHHRPLADLCAMPAGHRGLRAFRDQLLLDHLQRPLVAGQVAEAMRKG